MSDEPNKVTLTLNLPLSITDRETLARIERVAKPPASVGNAKTRSILFLRAVAGRASLCLPALYQFLGAAHATPEDPDIKRRWTYPSQVEHYMAEFSSLCVIALSLRAIFDHAKGPLSARTIASLKPEEAQSLAEYWKTKNRSKAEDADAGLEFVCDLLQRCAISIGSAKRSECVLTRRIAMLKAYADRTAAHITLQDYEFTIPDVAHAALATCLLGAVIHQFDMPASDGVDYLSGLDEASYTAALRMFPELRKTPRFFHKEKLKSMLPVLYRGRIRSGADYLSEWLPSTLGFDYPPRKFAEELKASKQRRTARAQNAGKSD
jgi:hypothetical protein